MATRKSVISQLANAGEEALGKLAQNPAAHKVLQGAVELRDKVDDLGKRVRGLEGMEQRLAGLEKRLEKMEKAARPKPSSGGAGKKKTAAAKKTS
jgi:hypothetical protein